jgi:hypothetical protein
MTQIKKSLAVAVTALALGASVFTSSAAEARGRYGWGVGAGIVGALAVGGMLAAASRPAYGYGYYGHPVYVSDGPAYRCRLVPRVNYYGEVIGHRRVCRTYY